MKKYKTKLINLLYGKYYRDRKNIYLTMISKVDNEYNGLCKIFCNYISFYKSIVFGIELVYNLHRLPELKEAIEKHPNFVGYSFAYFIGRKHLFITRVEILYEALRLYNEKKYK